MEEYITTTFNNLRTNNYENLNVILGNESCDLDSAVSALVYGTYLHWQHQQIKCKICTRTYRNEETSKDDIFVAVLNVDRSDFDLKTEVLFSFREYGIDVSKLIFRDDYDLRLLVTTKNTSVFLVDHHILSRRDQFLAPYVTEIIDHRPIDRSRWQYKDDTRSTVEIVGSCCTLICERIKNLSELMAKHLEFFEAYPTCTQLMHNTIILDTVNFSKDVKKGTAKDEDAVLFLESLIKPENFEEYRRSKYLALDTARSDVTNLTTAQLLKKDFKVLGHVLVPGFPILVEDVLKKPNIREALDVTLVRNDCTIALLLGKTRTTRDAAVYSTHHCEEAEKLIKILLEWTKPCFGLQRETSNVPNCIYFKQSNVAASRKQFMPAIDVFIRSCGK